MSVLFEKLEDDVHLIAYEIDKEPEYYRQGIDFTAFDLQEYESIANALKKTQWLASRFWLKKMSKKQQQLHLEKTDLGKPHFTNSSLHFSISHSRNYIAVICSEFREVAVDLETIQDKILKIKHKFIHPQDFEQGDNLERLAMIWSAKETIYKHYHTKELYSFKEQIAITALKDSYLTYHLSNFSNQIHDTVYYKKINDSILTWLIKD